MFYYITLFILGVIMGGFQMIGAGSDLSATQTQVNKTILELKNNEVTTVFKDDSGEYGVLIGKKPNGKRGMLVYTNGTPVIDIGQLADDSNGMKVSPTGTDVTTASDDDLVFNSNQNVFKITSTGTTTLSIPSSWTYTGTATTATIPHGLGFTPAFQVFVTIPNDIAYGFTWQAGNLTNLPTSLLGLTSGFAETLVYLQARADSTNLYLEAINTSGVTISNLTSTGFAFRYYILQETAN